MHRKKESVFLSLNIFIMYHFQLEFPQLVKRLARRIRYSFLALPCRDDKHGISSPFVGPSGNHRMKIFIYTRKEHAELPRYRVRLIRIRGTAARHMITPYGFESETHRKFAMSFCRRVTHGGHETFSVSLGPIIRFRRTSKQVARKRATGETRSPRARQTWFFFPSQLIRDYYFANRFQMAVWRARGRLILNPLLHLRACTLPRMWYVEKIQNSENPEKIKDGKDWQWN